MYLLGYDIGSSTLKVALINALDESVVGVVQYPDEDMDIIARQKGWAEQQPEIWWRNLCLATKKILNTYQIKSKDIKGIGIAYQMHGLVLVDKDLQILRPAIIWCDSRATSIGKEAFHLIGEDYCLQNYLNSPGNFTASKLKWVKDHEPHIYDKIHKIMLPGEYIAMKLTGQISTTIAGLSEGVFWNFKEKKVASKLLQHFGIDENYLPEVTPLFSSMGKVTKAAAKETGLSKGIPITYRAGDQPNNAVALNALRKGEVAATSGTSGVVYGIMDRPIYDEQSRVNSFAHVNYENNFDRFGMLLCINGAGHQYSWIKHQIALSGRSYNDMERMVASVPVGSEGVCILPFGNGSERIFNNRNLESHIYNLEFNRHTRAHLYRASLEGVAFTFVYGINLLKKIGLEVGLLRVGNDNMFKSKVFATTISTLLGIHIEVVETTGAIGAARAAGVGCGIYNSLEEAMQNVQVTNIYEPQLDFGMCSQAYNYWESSLNKILNKGGTRPEYSKKIMLQNQTLKKELTNKTKLITTQAIELQSNRALLNDLRNSLTEIKKENNSSKISEQINKIQRKINSLASSDEIKTVFEDHYDTLNDDFIQKLKKHFPKLTFEELKLCALLNLNYSTKDIATKLNLSVRGVETKRYRVRKKINLPKGIHFTDFFEQLI